jgi:hypothetical protein
MATASLPLVTALLKTADTLEASNHYQWGHMGSCNCGFLAQEITHLKKQDIHERAMRGHGDWTEQLNDYCPTSGLPMDDLISEMIAFGFDTDDLKHLERLSDPQVLQALPVEKRYLKHNIKADVVLYLRTWAKLMETELLNTIELPAFTRQQPSVL